MQRRIAEEDQLVAEVAAAEQHAECNPVDLQTEGWEIRQKHFLDRVKYV